ncbi:hypothetical protein OG21DRAFT_1506087 [Imleria badia]|nr:hypothetical protein OG21DRAFT_1506087 [Imleria badia]
MSLTRPKHNPLYVADIFHIILDFLSEPFTGYDNDSDIIRIRIPREEGRRALAALAQTCRMFSQPSLNCLWRKLDSLTRLLRCVFTKEEVIGIARTGKLRSPSLAEWRIIKRYSHRIQELEIWDDESIFLLEFSGFVLPNLRVLSWTLTHDPESVAFIRPLLGPTLVAFNLSLNMETFDDEESDADEVELRPFLETLPSICPGLKVVSFDVHRSQSGVEKIIPLLSQAVCSFDKLDRLAIRSPIDGVTLRHLIASPHFTQLLLSARQSQIEELSLPRSDTPFPDAKKISLFGLNLSSITGLLRSEGQIFSSTEFHLDIPPTSQLTLSFLTALASRPRRSSLQSIILDRARANSHAWPREPPDEFLDDHYVLSCDTLQPLIFFRELRELSIDLKNPISLNDEELVGLAHGWPMLRFLRFVSGNGLSTKHLTLRGLILLVAACPQLQRVDLCVDARDIPTCGVGMDVRSTTIKELNFPGSPINNPRLVAKFLSKHFPSIVLLLGPPYKWEPYAEEWVQVRDNVWLIKKDIIMPSNVT